MKQSVWAVLVFLLVPVVATAQSLTLTPPAGFTGGADVSALLKIADAVASGTMPASQAGVPSYELRVYAASADVTTATPVQKTKAPDTARSVASSQASMRRTLNEAKAAEFQQDVTDPVLAALPDRLRVVLRRVARGAGVRVHDRPRRCGRQSGLGGVCPLGPFSPTAGSGGKAPHRPWWRAVIDFLLRMAVTARSPSKRERDRRWKACRAEHAYFHQWLVDALKPFPEQLARFLAAHRVCRLRDCRLRDA
jgi:hypothetical protein